MITIDELQKLQPSAIIELYEVDLTPFGGTLVRFHAGTNELNQNLVWAGEPYTRYPVEVTGFSENSNGALARPTLKVSNFMSLVTGLNLLYKDLNGAKVTRIRTLAKYVDAVNFVSGVNPSADNTRKFADDIYYIERKVNENQDAVEYELVSAIDKSGLMLPKRQIIQNTCPFKYRGADCGYTGTQYFNRDDQTVTNVDQDVCGKKISSCSVRFGEANELPFGGFPGAGLINR